MFIETEVLVYLLFALVIVDMVCDVFDGIERRKALKQIRLEIENINNETLGRMDENDAWQRERTEQLAEKLEGIRWDIKSYLVAKAPTKKVKAEKSKKES